MWVRAVILATALMVAPLSSQAADLVVWWEKGYYPQEDAAIAEIVAAFEQKTGKRVELVRPAQDEVSDKVQATLEAGQPPDFLYGTYVTAIRIFQWAYEDRLVDLTAALGPLRDLFDAEVLDLSMLPNGRTGERGLYGLPMAWGSNHVHVWRSLLEQAGFTLADIPKEWEPFWAFWCNRVQPAVRKALGRDDIWGAGLLMSAAGFETYEQLLQFQLAYEAPWLGRDGRLQVDDPAVRAGMVKALDAYTAIGRQGCTPPTRWDGIARGTTRPSWRGGS